MLTIKKNTDHHAFILMTLGITDHLLFTPSFNHYRASEFLSRDLFNDLKSNFLIQTETSGSASISLDHSKILIVLVDSICKIFLSVNPNIEPFKQLLADEQEESLEVIERSIDFYLKMSNKMFSNYREFYKDNKDMITMLDGLTKWNTKI